jgi:hypothetical protein
MELVLGDLLIVALVFGTALPNDWSTAGVQMVYAVICSPLAQEPG